MIIEVWLYFFLVMRNALEQHSGDLIDGELRRVTLCEACI
jgi:hypothetical protein